MSILVTIITNIDVDNPKYWTDKPSSAQTRTYSLGDRSHSDHTVVIPKTINRETPNISPSTVDKTNVTYGHPDLRQRSAQPTNKLIAPSGYLISSDLTVLYFNKGMPKEGSCPIFLRNLIQRKAQMGHARFF